METELIPPATPEDLALDLDAILARAEAATPGPWEVDCGTYRDRDTDDFYVATPNGAAVWDERGACERTDAAFIAAARQDVPALVRLVAHWKREAEETTERLEAIIARARDAASISDCLECDGSGERQGKPCFDCVGVGRSFHAAEDW